MEKLLQFHPVPRVAVSLRKPKRRLTRSIKVSAEIYERLVSLQGFLQLKERRKRSMDELIEYTISFMPDLEIDVDENFYIVQTRERERAKKA
jgi:hypothetical protein